jgi:hypothetical protein
MGRFWPVALLTRLIYGTLKAALWQPRASDGCQLLLIAFFLDKTRVSLFSLSSGRAPVPRLLIEENNHGEYRNTGITVNAAGYRLIDSKHRGIRIFRRLGLVGEHEAARRLTAEIQCVEAELERRAHARPRFIDCAARYLAESGNKRSVGDTAWHVRLLFPYIGDMEMRTIHDGTLQDFIRDRLASGVTSTTSTAASQLCERCSIAPRVCIATTPVVRGSKACRHSLQWWPRIGGHPTPSRGKSRISSSQNSQRASRAWRSS